MLLQQADIRKLIVDCFPFQPGMDQERALDAIGSFIYRFREPSVFLLKGYAGTGKTSLIAALVKALPSFNVKSVLLAPTGRAAKVLSTYSGKSAFTIHKKIYFSSTDAFGRIQTVLQENKHINTLFIVDEASMIPDAQSSMEDSFSYRSLLEDLFAYVHSGLRCKLLLLGDSAQLPPVGSEESPALDIAFLESCFGVNIETIELTEVLRQAQNSDILKNATALRNQLKEASLDLPFFQLRSPSDLICLQGAELEDVLYTEYAKKERADIVIITRSNKRANLFNKEVRYRILGQESRLSAGDLLMVIKNNYFWIEPNEKISFIANGDMIEVLKIKRTQEIYGFTFADIEAGFIDYPNEAPIELKILLDCLEIESAAMPYDKMKDLWDKVSEDYTHIKNLSHRKMALKKDPYINALQVKFSYALTCHKTQGGQWKTVFIDRGFQSTENINPEYLRWLYTALTRSTQKAYLLNFEDAYFGDKGS